MIADQQQNVAIDHLEEAAQLVIKFKRPRLYPKQLDAIFSPKRYSLIEASTKAGKTFGCMAWLLEQACIKGKPGREFWWVAPVYNQAKIAYKRYRRMLRKLRCKFNDSVLTIELPNGAILVFKSGEKPDNLYGEDVWAAVIDEASRVREDAWHAVRSTLTATRGPVRMIGNVKGRKNWFYRMCRIAEAGEADMHYAKLTAQDAVAGGVLKQKEIDSARRDLPERIFQELYMAEPSDDDGNPFGIVAIRACIAPLSTDPVYVWGIDLAKSHDWTVLIGLDRLGRVCHFERYQIPWKENVARIRRTIGDTRALVDSTGVGDAVLEFLQRGNRKNFEGQIFTNKTKQQMMEGLAVAIQSKEIFFPEGTIVNELENFEYTYNTRGGVSYSAPEGLYDDCVCALALAQRLFGTPDPMAGILAYYDDQPTNDINIDTGD